MLILQSVGGLCNRIRAIDTMLSLSRKIDTKLVVYWDRNDELNASFTALFDFRNQFVLKETKYHSKNHPSTKIKNLIARIKLYRFFKFLGYSGVYYVDDIVKMKEQGFDFTSLDRDKNYYFYFYAKIIENPTPYQEFTPQPYIMKIIDQVTAGFTPHTIGVHIRRTDNTHSIKNSPVQLFVDRMAKELELNPLTNFYLATDDPETEQFVESNFPGKIMKYSKELSRSSETGIRDAVVDLWALSRTKKILGSFYSSFSHTAAEIGGIPEITIKE